MTDRSYKAIELVLWKEAHAAAFRARRSGVTMPSEDWFQELSIAYVKALDHFNPQHGVKFATYLIRACRNHVLDVVRQARNPRRFAPTVSIEVAFHGAPAEEVLADEAPTIEDRLCRQSTWECQLGRLTPLTRVLVELLLEPPPEIQALVKGAQTGAAAARMEGRHEHAPHHLTLDLVRKACRVSDADYRVCRLEIEKKFGVKV